MEEKDKYFRNFIFIAIGVVIVSLAFPFIVKHFLSNWSTSGTFGDTFGALNAIFSGIALAGLIITILIQRKELENQRTELALQRTEMQETRKEFLINRITNIVYSQLERYEKGIEQFEIKYQNKTYQGHEAIFFLDNMIQTVYITVFDNKTETEILQEKKKNNCFAMKIYSTNDIAIAQFALAAYNSVQAVKETLYRSNLSVDEMNDLKNLFFRNIGFIQIDVLEDIQLKFVEFLQFSTAENDNFINECEVEPGKLSKASIFLKSILKFRSTIITTENLKEIRDNWVQEFGARA